MTARRSLPILLILALLFAQQAGQAHALSHLELDSLKDGVSHTTLCAKCATFGQLSSFVPATDSLTLDAPSHVSLHTIVSCSSVRRTATAFQSRAPPLLA
jgi:hypothetical protein